MPHEYLSPNLEYVGDIAPLQLRRNVRNGAHIGRDILTRRAVSPRRPENQLTFLVTQRNRKPIDLWLGCKGGVVSFASPEKPPHAINEIAHILIIESVAQRQHRHRMRHLGEFL